MELLDGSVVAHTLRFGEREGVRCRFARGPVADLSAADVGRNLVGKAHGIEGAESRAPRVPEDRNLVLSKALPHGIDQLVEIGDELVDLHGGSGNLAVERLAGASLFPVDDGEAPLERCVEVAEQRRLRETWSTVQEYQ